MAMHLAATLLPSSKRKNCANSMNEKYFHVGPMYTLLTTKLVMVINKAHIKRIVLMALLYCNYYYIFLHFS